MEKLYIKLEDGSHAPTQLHRVLGRKVDEVIKKLFDELINENEVDIVEAKYIIDSSVTSEVLDRLINL